MAIGKKKEEVGSSRSGFSSDTGSAPSPSDDQIVTDVTIVVLDALDQIHIPKVEQDDIEITLGTMSDLWHRLNGMDFMLDAGRGYANWLKGEILLRLKPLPGMGPEWPKLLQHGEYERFLKQHGVSASSAYWWRRIRRDIRRQDARHMGYDEMRAQFSPSFREALEKLNNTMPPNGDESGAESTGIADTGTEDPPTKVALLINLPQTVARLNEQLNELREDIKLSPVSCEPEKLSDQEVLELEHSVLGQISLKLEATVSLCKKTLTEISVRQEGINNRIGEIE